MTNEYALSIIRDLGKSQGMYSRLYSALKEADEESRTQYLEQFKGCKDEVDLIMQVEE